MPGALENISQCSALSCLRLRSIDQPDSDRSAQGDIAATPAGISSPAFLTASATEKARPPPEPSPARMMPAGAMPEPIRAR